MLVDQYCSSADHRKILTVPAGTDIRTLKITLQDAGDILYAPGANFDLLRRSLEVESGMNLIAANAEDILIKIEAKGYAKHEYVWETRILPS